MSGRDRSSEIDRWFDEVQSKLAAYRQRMRKESTFKRFKNRRKGKLFRLRTKLKRLTFRAGRLARQPTGENKRNLQRLDEIIGKVKKEAKQVKRELRCLNLVKNEFSAQTLKQELESIRSKQSADQAEFRRWRSELIRALFGPPATKLRKLNRQQRRTRNYFACASINVKNLIRVRSLWDKYLVDSSNETGSSIPLTYVLPDFKPNEQWEPYLGKLVCDHSQ